MSLVNDMLRDLDRRQSPENASPAQAAGYGALTQNGEAGISRRLSILLVMALLLVAALAGFFGWQVWDSKRKSSGVLASHSVSSSAMVEQHQKTLEEDKVVVAESESSNEIGNADKGKITSAVEPDTKEIEVETQDLNTSNLPKPSQDLSKEDDSAATVPNSPALAETPDTDDLEDARLSEKPSSEIASQPEKLNLPDHSPSTMPVDLSSSHSHKPASRMDEKHLLAQTDKETRADKRELTEPVVQPRPEEAKTVKLPVQTPEQLDKEAAEYGLMLFQQDRLRESMMSLMSFIQKHELNARSRYALALVYFQQQMLDEAGQLISQDDLGQAPMRELKARILLARKQISQAIELLRYIEPPLPGNESYHALLASLYQRAGQHENAVTKYTELLNLKPSEGKWWIGLAISLEPLGQRQSALKAYQRGLQERGLSTQLVQFSRQRIQALADQTGR